MAGQREGRANWLDFFPFEEHILKVFKGGEDSVMLVDVGGTRGHEIQAIKERHPSLPGRLILQDLPDTVAQALPVQGMQSMAHDFFNPQPVKGTDQSTWAHAYPRDFHRLSIKAGARAYYLRSILHDWPDEKCQIIISQLAAVMTKGYSKIILNEMVVPDQVANLLAVQVDIAMMTVCAAMERTERQWREVVDSAGLKAERIWTDVPEAESIMEVGLK